MQLLTIQYSIILKSKLQFSSIKPLLCIKFPKTKNCHLGVNGGKVAGDYIAKCAESFD